MSQKVFNEFLIQQSFELQEQFSYNSSMDRSVEVWRSGSIWLRRIGDRGRKYLDLSYTGNDTDWAAVFDLVARIDPNYAVRNGSESEAIAVLLRYWKPLYELLIAKPKAL
jgi:hypothetical protein